MRIGHPIFHSLLQSRCGRHQAADPGADRGCASATDQGGNRGRLLLVRSSATLVQASGDSTGGRAHIEQIVDVPVPRILEQHVDVIKVIPEEWMSKRIVQQIVDVPVPQIPKHIVGVVLVILQEQCQRMRFFFF